MKKSFIKNHYNELTEIFNCVKVGIYITDGKGNTLLVNDESCRSGGLDREEVLGKNMKELEEIGFIEESATLLTLKNEKEVSIIQSLGDGGKVYVTGTPLIKNEKIDLVVCTERDVTETLMLRDLLKEQDSIAEKFKKELEYLRTKDIDMWGSVVAVDEKSKKTMKKALRIAHLGVTVLLTGESGTGKEVFANLIYKNSSRAGKPFIKINCAAIPEKLLESEFFGYEPGSFTGADKHGKIGIFELANTGTLFLDEIGEIPVYMQSKLLRVLQEKEVMRIGGQKTIPINVRLISATNKNLEQEIKEGRFRGDLYYRLNVVPIEILPLRERKEDIKALALYFVKSFNKSYVLNKKITQDAISALENYNWPGNIRELENVIERIMISFDGDEITKFQIESMLKTHLNLFSKELGDGTENFDELVENFEKLLLQEALEKYKKPVYVSKELGINKSTLSRKLKKYGL